jgi:polyketide synthase 12
MAARLDPTLQRRLLAQGIRPLAPDRGLRHLDAALRSAAAQVVVLPFDRERLAERLAGGPVPSLLRGLVAQPDPTPAVTRTAGLRAAIAGTPPAERRAGLISALRRSAAEVLGAHPTAVDPRRPLSDLGLDSLMTVDLQATLNSALGLTLAPTVLLEHPTLVLLATFILRELGLAEHDAPATDAPDTTDTTDAAASQLRQELAALEALMA